MGFPEAMCRAQNPVGGVDVGTGVEPDSVDTRWDQPTLKGEQGGINGVSAFALGRKGVCVTRHRLAA